MRPCILGGRLFEAGAGSRGRMESGGNALREGQWLKEWKGEMNLHLVYLDNAPHRALAGPLASCVVLSREKAVGVAHCGDLGVWWS